MKSALAELKRGDPDHKAVEFIHNAVSELATRLDCGLSSARHRKAGGAVGCRGIIVP